MNAAEAKTTKTLQCPSAQPDMAQPTVLGVATGSAGSAAIAYLDAPLPVTPELLQLSGEIAPTKIFRFAAACEERRCTHFDGVRCRLAERIVATLPVVVDELPQCTIRSECRWYAEQGAAACHRCPQIVTLNDGDDPQLVQIAMPWLATAPVDHSHQLFQSEPHAAAPLPSI